MIQLQLDHGNALGKIAPDIVHTHVQPDRFKASALRFDHHIDLLSGLTEISSGSNLAGSRLLD
jgi:hypothetical protein